MLETKATPDWASCEKRGVLGGKATGRGRGGVRPSQTHWRAHARCGRSGFTSYRQRPCHLLCTGIKCGVSLGRDRKCSNTVLGHF